MKIGIDVGRKPYRTWNSKFKWEINFKKRKRLRKKRKEHGEYSY